jgi:glycosyltransferase involved in cell wall biosynthesis
MSETKKVLHVIDSLDLGGAQTFLLDLVNHHDRTRFIPEVAVMHGAGVYAKAFMDAGVSVHSLSPLRFPPFYIPNFWKLMNGGNYDLLHFHLFGANLCAKPIAVMSGHPAIVVHDQCNDASRDQNPLLLAADAFWNRKSHRIIAVSESTRRYLLAHEDLDDSSVVTISNGIDTERFRPAIGAQRKQARSELGMPADAFVIGGVGRLVFQKNFLLFLKVASNILKHYPEVRFAIAGTGPLEPILRAEAENLGISSQIIFLGHVSNRQSLYHALDILLITSDFEGTPMTLLEAMASGIPVVASGVDGIAEVCSDGVNSLLALPGNSISFEQSLSRIISDQALRDDFASAGRRTILERYDIKGITERVERVYDELLCKRDSEIGR